MKILFVALVPFIVALVLHLILWRIRLPRNQTVALLFIFFLVFALWSLPVFSFVVVVEWLRAAMLYVAAAFSYVITYSGFEGDSPTLGFMRALSQSGDKGFSDEDVAAFLARRPFLRARLSALLRTGMIREEHGYYFTSGQRSRAFHLVLAFRKLYGPISRGG
jgi:glucan phosphoethanolaminetransferase (alkaline phosphatase superfamily)